MTRKELSSYYYIVKLKKEAELELNRLLEERTAKSQKMDGMPFQNTNDISDPTAQLAMAIDEQYEVLQGIAINLRKKECEILKYIKEVQHENPYLALIIKYRCLDCLSWNQVADRIGDNATEDSCRKYYIRNTNSV